jgi:hypothetical protein
VYDFNRCTGEITNPVEYDLSNYFNEDVTNACCLSPDGTKLYFRRSNMEALLTIELCQYDFETSTFSVIAEANGAPCTTPNNQWVVAHFTDISSKTYIPKISIIYSPNEPAAECNFQEGVYDMINYGFIEVSPNCANFRLGALAGSPCDTLFTGISNMKNLNFKIYPNPVESSLTIELDNATLNEIRITDMLGRTVWRGKTKNHKTVLNKEIEELEQGIYWLEIQDMKTGKRGGAKFIKK